MIQNTGGLSDLTDSLDELSNRVNVLESENEILRKALAELADEKMTMAYNWLGSSLKIRMLLQPQQQPEQQD